MLDLSTPRREHRGACAPGRHPERDQAWPSGGIISPAPRPGLPVRSWKDLPTRPPFGTPSQGLRPDPAATGLLEEKDAGPAPSRPPGGL